MTKKSATSVRHFSCRESRAMFISLLIYHCCYSSKTISALQVHTRNTRSLFSSRSLLSSETTIVTKGSKRRRQRHASFSSSLNLQENNFQDNVGGVDSSPGMNRRDVFSNSAKALFAGLATPFLLDPSDPANALLLRFPVDAFNTQPLKNKYHFLRAGTSELEAEGIYSTNPLFLTNRDNALSDKGYDSLKEALTTLKKTPCQPTLVYHSLAANGMDTGDLIARELKLGRDRLMPEFTYLDQRGIGLWDSNEEALIRPAVWALDTLEAGAEGFGGRTPANTDGTPNDTLHDQFTRLRQFLSLQETRTSGETILVIFPDGTGPALLSCMIAGIPYSECHALEYKPGELQLDITVDSIREMYVTRKDDPAYLETIEDGKEKLKELRNMNPKQFSVSFKDSQADQKQEEENRVYYEKQQAIAAERQKVAEERRAALQEEIRLSKEKAQEKQAQRRKEELAIKEKKDQKLRDEKEIINKKRAEQQAALLEKKQKQAEAQAAAKQKYEELAAAQAAAQVAKKGQQIASERPESSLPFGLSPTVLATAAFGAIGGGAIFLSETEDEDENNSYSTITAGKNGSGGSGDTVAKIASIPDIEDETKKDQPKLEPIHSAVTATSIVSQEETQRKKDQPKVEPLHFTKKDDNSGDGNDAETTPISPTTEKEKLETKDELTSIKTEGTKKKQKPKFKPLHSMNKDDGDDTAAAQTTSTPTPMQQENSPVVTKHWRRNRKTPRYKRQQHDVSMEQDPNEDGSVVDASSKKSEDEFTTKLKAAEQEMKDAFIEAADVQKKKQQNHQSPKKSSLFDNDPPVIVTKKITKTTNFVFEDDEDDSDWLRVLSEIRDEEKTDEDDDFGMVDYKSLVDDAQL